MSLPAGPVEVVPSRRAEPVTNPDLESLEVGIRHLERLYLELGSLGVQLQDSAPAPTTSGVDAVAEADAID